jgi:long-chain fatty acid transport protein
VLCANQPAGLAGGLSVPGQGARPLSMGGAFTAVADDGNAIYYNPAGICQMKDTQIEAGLAFIFPEISYQMPNGATERSSKNAYAPTLFITHPFTEKLSAGLGLYAPYTREAVYHDDLANGFPSQRSKMVRTDLSPVVSYQVLEQLALSVGLVGSYGVIDQSLPAGPALRITDNTDGYGLGGIAGLLWKITKYVQVGGTYRSRMTVYESGDRTMEQAGVATTSDAKVDVHYPSSLGMGLAVKPIEQLVLAFDADWYEWSYMDSITTRTDLWPDQTAELNTDDSWDFRVGGEYKLPRQFAVRAGYGYIQGAIPNSHILPCKPDASAHEFDIGVGKTIGPVKLDLNYEYVFANEEVATANIYGLNGKYNIAQHLFGVSATYQF